MLTELTGRLAWLIAPPKAAARAGLDRGELAALRRLDADSPACAAFWRLLIGVVEPAYDDAGVPVPRGIDREPWERAWATVINALAVTEGLSGGPRLGAALFDAGYSDQRLERLLAADDDGLRDRVRVTARFLAAKAQAFAAGDLTWLVMSQGESRESARRAVARAFYRRERRAVAQGDPA